MLTPGVLGASVNTRSWSAARARDVNQTISAGFPQSGPGPPPLLGGEKEMLKARGRFGYLKRKWKAKGVFSDI